MNLALVARTDMPIDDQPDIFWGNIGSRRAEDSI